MDFVQVLYIILLVVNLLLLARYIYELIQTKHEIRLSRNRNCYIGDSLILNGREYTIADIDTETNTITVSKPFEPEDTNVTNNHHIIRR